MPQNVVTRFAPSPTGRLHLGHAWSALCAHDLAREAGGAFLLRIEDIDTARCRAEFVDGIFEDLRWLGFDWDGEVMFQSQRTAHYQAALAALIDRGLAYRCWCTRTEIAAAAAAAPHGDYGPLYPGTCRGRSDPGDGRPYCWRLDVLKAVRTTGPLRWRDFREGPVIASPQMLGDVVIARKDAETSYHLAVTLDDAAQEVSHVVRGIDLFRSTHLHRLLQALFHLPPPEYRHHDLVVDDDGERLAKRRNAPTIAALRQAGVDPIRLISGMRDGRFPVGFHLPDD